MPMHISPTMNTDLSRIETMLPRMGPIASPLPPATQSDIFGILQREQDRAIALLSSSPLLASLFVSYANQAATLESASATPSPESEEWKALQNTIDMLHDEIEKLKSENLEMAGGLEAAEASQQAFRSQVSSLKEVNTAQQDDIKCLRAELTEAKDGYDRLLVNSNAEAAALEAKVLELETQRAELRDTIVEQQVRISRLERQGSSSLPGPAKTAEVRRPDIPEDQPLASTVTILPSLRSKDSVLTDSVPGSPLIVPTPPVLSPVPIPQAVPDATLESAKPQKQVKIETPATPKPQPAPSPMPVRQPQVQPPPSQVTAGPAISLASSTFKKINATPSTSVPTPSNGGVMGSPPVLKSVPEEKKPITIPTIVEDRKSVFNGITPEQKSGIQLNTDVEASSSTRKSKKSRSSVASMQAPSPAPTPQETLTRTTRGAAPSTQSLHSWF